MAIPEYRSQHRDVLPATHRPRNGKVHDNDRRDLPPAPVLTAVEEENPPEGVKENQHHGHKSCRERQRGVNREPPILAQPAGSGKDGEELGKGSRGTAGLDWEALRQTLSVGGMAKRSREDHRGRSKGFGTERCGRGPQGAQMCTGINSEVQHIAGGLCLSPLGLLPLWWGRDMGKGCRLLT